MSVNVFVCMYVLAVAWIVGPNVEACRLRIRSCPSGMVDDGTSCWRHTYGRGVGRIRYRCRSNEDRYGWLCYRECRRGYHAVGCCLCEPNGGPGIKLTLFNRMYFGDCDFSDAYRKASAELGRSLYSSEVEMLRESLES